MDYYDRLKAIAASKDQSGANKGVYEDTNQSTVWYNGKFQKIIWPQICIWSGNEREQLDCPQCGYPLALDGMLTNAKDGESGETERDEYGTEVPDSVVYMFKCTKPNNTCDSTVIIGERSNGINPFPKPNDDAPDALVLQISLIDPPLPLLPQKSVKIPNNVTVSSQDAANIKNDILNLSVAAGRVVWRNPAAALNLVRQAGELFLDLYSISRATANGGFNSFNNRINAAESQEVISQQVRDALHNIRQSGNSGSHSSNPAASQPAQGPVSATTAIEKWELLYSTALS